MTCCYYCILDPQSLATLFAHIVFALHFQGLLTSTPDMTSFSLNVDHHDHGSGGHYHGVDLDHPVLALSMTSISIFVKEGYVL